MTLAIRRSGLSTGIAAGITVLAVAAIPAAAQDTDAPAWRTRVSIGRVVSQGESTQIARADGTTANLSTDDGVAVLYDVSRRITKRTHVQFGFGYWTFPSRLSDSATDELKGFRAGELHVGIVYQMSAPRRINPYGAALIVANSADVAETRSRSYPVRVSLASRLQPAVQAGVLIGGCRSQPIGVDLSVRRSLLRTTVSGGAPYDLSPWVFSAAISIRH
jgi:hypothetical protein